VENLQKRDHDLWNMPQVASRLLHVEVLAEAQVPEDIENEPVHPVTHVERGRPLAIFGRLLANQLQPSINVGVKEDLGISERCLRESVIQHTALARMDTDTGAAPRVDSVDIARPHFVVDALLDIAFWSEDLLEGGRSVKHNTVRTIAELRPCCPLATS
jgi:hypothetical protein